MQMLNLKKMKSKFKNINLKKSHICLFGSLLVILGAGSLLSNHIISLKNKLFSEMELSLLDNDNIEEIIDGIPTTQEVKNTEEKTSNIEQPSKKNEPINYSKYLGVLEIPAIRLKRGFYGFDSKYNNIEYNVTLIRGSAMPDVPNGNLILAAHSGDAYISYFAYLWKLDIGDVAYVTYNGNKYKYTIVNIYNVPKTGTVTINRNMEKNNLTLITCTKDSDTEQTIYIAELT